MIETAEQMKRLVAQELDRFHTVEKGFFVPFITPPRLYSLTWDYSPEPASYLCWLIAELQPKGIRIFYSESGHGKHHPWGVIPGWTDSYGRDDSWFISLEDAVINSGCWSGELPEGYEIG